MTSDIKRRTPTKAGGNWPFLFEVVPGQGLVQNVAEKNTHRVKLLPGVLDPEPTPRATLWPFTPTYYTKGAST